MIFKGIFTAMITPFNGKKIDFPAFENLIKRQIDANIDGIIVAGSTGEGTSLLEGEYYSLIHEAVKYSNGRIAVIAGSVATSTLEATEKVKKLCALGVDGIMCTAPHYVRPEQRGLLAHYKLINAASTLPVMVYIHPPRTGCDLTDNTLLEISNFDNIYALKDASSDLEKPLRILPKAKAGFSMLTGNDANILAYNANGGMGCVSVISNIFPKLYKKINDLSQNNNLVEARLILQKLLPLLDSIFQQSNPIGIKQVAANMSLCNKDVRLPLTHMGEDSIDKINQMLNIFITMENNV